MEYRYVPYEQSHYATNMRYDARTNNVIWDAPSGQDALIVQTPFGKSAEARMKDICKSLANMPGLPVRYTELSGCGGVRVLAVSAAERARDRGCPLNGGASTYTVFSYTIKDDICSIYQPLDQGAISAHCDIPLYIQIDIKKDVRTEGIFKKRTIETDFFILSFPPDISSGYTDGDLQYCVGDLVIPVTRQMVEHGEIYVKSKQKPEIISQNSGLRLKGK